MASATETSKAIDFVRVPSCVLRILDRTRVDLFLQHDPLEPQVLYREADYPLSQDRAEGLVEICDESLFVRAADYANFSKDLRQPPVIAYFRLPVEKMLVSARPDVVRMSMARLTRIHYFLFSLE